MSHDIHNGPDDAVLYDGCAECDDRADMGMAGILYLDARNVARLASRMQAVEYGHGADSYRSRNEARLGRELYYVSLLLQRHPEVLQ